MAVASGQDKGGGPRVDALYNLMQSFENKLGGGEGIEGLYGSITQQGMQRVLECLKNNTGLDHRSTFIDIGAGLGRPLLHALISAGVLKAWGIELDRVKCDKAASFCQHVMSNLVAKKVISVEVAVPPVHCSPVEKFASLDPATHAYSFWEGVPTSGKMAFGELFAASKSLRAVAVVQRAMRGAEPAAVMRELGFGPLMLLASFPVKMSGSGRSFTAYVFSKMTPEAQRFFSCAAAAGGALPAAAATGLTSGAVEAAAGEQRPTPSEVRSSLVATAEEEAALDLELSQPFAPSLLPASPQQPANARAARAAARTAAAVGSSQQWQVEELPRAASRGSGGGVTPRASASPQEQSPVGSPAKARKSADGAPGPASPAKKPCNAASAEADMGVTPCRAASAAAAASGKAGQAAFQQAAADAASAVKPPPSRSQQTPQPERPALAAVPQRQQQPKVAAAKQQQDKAAPQQRLLTSMPDFSRRTKQTAAVGKPGKPAPVAKPPAAAVAAAGSGMRTSRRLAAKALAADVAAAVGLGTAVEGQ